MTISALYKKKIAVIGSGISGLSCAWLLNKAHDVTLFEKDDRLGGHTNTVTFDHQGQSVAVDTGFIVFNPVNYPNLVQFFETLQVNSCETEMSFAVSAREGALEYSGSGLQGLIAQKRNLLRPSFWRMLKDLLRFYREAQTLLDDEQLTHLSLGDLLQQGGYSNEFIHDHLLPMSAAIWSTPAQQMLEYPAQSFLRFCHNHGLLQVNDRPVWRTVPGGSHHYVNRIAAELKGKIRLNSRIHRVVRNTDGVVIQHLHGQQEYFDEVVLACHSDQALQLLDQPTRAEQEILGCFPYQRNKAYLHTDIRLMPQRLTVWSSWNYLTQTDENSGQQVSVTYWMNRLQPLPVETPLLVSLNPLQEPHEGSIIRSFFYDHPVFSMESIAAQKLLWQLQGQQRTWFCGAYFGYGFHEDGLQSGLAVAEQLGGIPRPWSLTEPNSRIHVVQPLKRVDKVMSLERSHG